MLVVWEFCCVFVDDEAAHGMGSCVLLILFVLYTAGFRCESMLQCVHVVKLFDVVSVAIGMVVGW